MKSTKGFAIEIQDSLGLSHRRQAEEFATWFIGEVTVRSNWNHLTCGGPRPSDDKHWPLQRGVYGHEIGHSGLVFRRACKNQRIFQIVKADELVLADSGYTCKCPCIMHRGGQKVINKYGDTRCSRFYTTGVLKG
jgi:hypothetical protein